MAGSYALYARLLEPLRLALAGVHHLLVVPDEVLLPLPFSVLITQTQGGRLSAAWPRQPAQFSLCSVWNDRGCPSVLDIRGQTTLLQPGTGGTLLAPAETRAQLAKNFERHLRLLIDGLLKFLWTERQQFCLLRSHSRR